MAAGSKLVVQYDTDWNLNSISGGDTTDFCESGCTINSVGATSTTNQVTVTGLFPS